MRLLLALLAALAVAAPAHAQQWFEAETAHFIIKSRDSEENVREFAETVERFDRGMRFLQGMPQDHAETSRANKPVIYRFGDIGDMARMYGDPGSGVGGFFISRAGNSVAFAPARRERSNNSRGSRRQTISIEQVLLHEYVHYFMLQNVPATYPRWYTEGYAEMVSTMRFEDDGSFHIGDPPQSRGTMINAMPASRLTEMLDDDRVITGYDAYQHYVTGWLFSHYLSFTPEREAKLRQYLAALSAGEESLAAAERIFGDLNQVQRELIDYKRGPFPGYNVRPDLTATPEVSLRPIEGSERALIEHEMRLQRGVTREQAADTARAIRAVLAEYPDSAQGHALLAEAEHDARNYAGGAAAAERAVALDPAQMRGWLYRARNALELAKTDPAQYAVARQHLAAARRVDADDPRPLIDYYDTYYRELGGANLPEASLIALEAALDEAGSDVGYRMMLGRQLTIEERYDDAMAVLRPALYQGHSFRSDEEDDFTPDRLFDALRSGDRARALALFEKAMAEDDDEA